MDIEIPQLLVDRMSTGHCVVFVGAGLSVGAGFPTWADLLTKLLDWVNERGFPFEKRSDCDAMLRERKFLQVASIVIESIGRESFSQFLRGTFLWIDRKPTNNHRLLPKIPFDSVLTSNYDDLIEKGYSEAKDYEPPSVIDQTNSSSIGTILASNRFHILKTHGTAERPESIILTRKDYGQLIHGNGAYRIYLQNLFSRKTVLFLGFSLSDPDLDLVLGELNLLLNGNTPRHFALMDGSTITSTEAEHLLDSYGIEVLRYVASDGHPEVTNFLENLSKKVPSRVLMSVEELRKDLENIDSHYRIVASSEGEYSVYEKYPGAALDKPLEFSASLKFDTKTQAGREAMEEFQNHVDTGKPIRISSEFIDKVELPDLVGKLFNFEPIDQVIEISPPTDSRILKTSITFIPDGLEEFRVDGVEIKRLFGGEKQATLSNDHQTHALKVKLVVNFLDTGKWRGDLTMSFRQGPLTLAEELLTDRIIVALNTGTRIRFQDVETGKLLHPDAYIKHTEPVTHRKRWIPILEDLITIEGASNGEIRIPESLTNEQAHEVANVAYLIRNGKGTAEVNFELEMAAARLKTVLDATSPVIRFGRYQDFKVTIGPNVIPLGGMWISGEVELNQSEYLQQIDEDLNETYVVKLSTTKKNPAITFCLDFLTDEDFEALYDQTDFRSFGLDYLISLLFEAARDDNGRVDFNRLIELFRTASEQTNIYDRPLNMLPRCTPIELLTTLVPLKENLSPKEWIEFIRGLISLSIVSIQEINLFSVLTEREFAPDDPGNGNW